MLSSSRVGEPPPRGSGGRVGGGRSSRRGGTRILLRTILFSLVVAWLVLLVAMFWSLKDASGTVRSALDAAKERIVVGLVTARAGGGGTASSPPAGLMLNVDKEDEDVHHGSSGKRGELQHDDKGGAQQRAGRSSAIEMAGSSASTTTSHVGTRGENGSVGSQNDNSRGEGGTASGEGNSGRWRGNDYVRESGVLPYQRCGAANFSPGPRPIYSEFTHGGSSYTLAVLGVTMWGASDETGKPTRADSVQMALFWQFRDKPCEVVHASKHCIIPDIQPPIKCRVVTSGEGAGEWAEGWRDRSRERILFERQIVPIDSIFCPFPGGAAALSDEFAVELRFGDSFDASASGSRITASIDICYEHVAKAANVTVCTAPQFGYGPTSSYWAGRPSFDGFTMLESFILWHTHMMGIHISFYDTEEGFSGAMEAFRHWGNVSYRPNMGLYEVQHPKFQKNGYPNPYSYQTQSETACFWQLRFKTKWVLHLHSADCYLFPEHPDKTFKDTMALIDQMNVSEVRIPRLEAYSHPPGVKNVTAADNVILRFPLISRGGMIKQKEYTPLGNPRDYDASNVHVFTANRSTARGFVSTRDAVFKLLIRTIHILPASRPSADKHAGRNFVKFHELGMTLQGLLQQWKSTRTSGPWDPPFLFLPDRSSVKDGGRGTRKRNVDT